jgi:hypothetical protein
MWTFAGLSKRLWMLAGVLSLSVRDRAPSRRQPQACTMAARPPAAPALGPEPSLPATVDARHEAR